MVDQAQALGAGLGSGGRHGDSLGRALNSMLRSLICILRARGIYQRIFFFFFLAVLGLSCHMWDLLAAACGI